MAVTSKSTSSTLPQTEITLPHKYAPRPYQLPFLRAMDSGNYHYAALVWARRHGKDITCWNWAIKEAAREPMTVTYVYPTHEMGKDNLWDAKTNDGMPFTDFVPLDLRRLNNSKDDGLNNTSHQVRLKNGSIIQLKSAEKPDRLRGGNTKIYILSEFAEMDPKVIDVIEPVVEANGGKIIINFTPKGDNHAKGAWEAWIKDKAWFTQMITAKDTDVFKPGQLQQIRARLIARYLANGRSEEDAIAFFEQEYYCSFETPVVGSYYGAAMRKALEEKRIGRVPYEPQLPVHTYWGLGVGDSNAIWFAQTVGREIRIIDYYKNSGEGLPHYIKLLQEKPYVYGRHVAPHDIEVREYTSGKSRRETAQSLGIRFDVAPKLPLDDGIDAVRTILPRCWFDEEKCKRGINILKSYHKVYDDKRQVYKNTPEHDWSSHGADAFRMFAVGYQEYIEEEDFPNEDLFNKNGFY